MADKPIIFSGPMIRALLDGRKTQTRRVLTRQNVEVLGDRWGKNAPWSGLRFDEAWVREKSAISGVYMPHLAVPFCHPEDEPEPTDECAIYRITPVIEIGDRLFPAVEIPSLNRNYCADLHGRVWSRARDGETWSVLKGGRTGKGYLSVTPAHNGKYETRLIHRLVAEAFYGFQPRGFKQVRHLNGDQIENAPENLDWGTQEDNWSDRYAHGRGSGEDHHASHLTIEDIDYIRSSSASQRALASTFSVAQSTIWAIKSGKYWQANPQSNPPNLTREFSRLTLVVSDVRVQRVQEISVSDVLAEGILPQHSKAREDFRDLWDSINAKRGYGWDENPWVVALTFRTITQNIDAIDEAESALSDAIERDPTFPTHGGLV